MVHALPGKSHPLGSTIHPHGVNFSVFSKNSTAVELLLFDHTEAQAPSHIFRLDPIQNRTGYYWHIFVPGLQAGQLYGWRVSGPNRPDEGLRFDNEKVLLDPYGRGVAMGKNYSRALACRPGSNAHACLKSVVVDPRAYDWEGDLPLKHPISRTIIYEMHVRGFTCHPTSGLEEQKRGTYAGLIEKIPYLKALGITAVELLPIFQFDPQDAPPGLTNYWGYSPISFFAPHAAYSSRRDPLGPVNEFRDMVKALHRAGIEVILDVVYNHTTENGADGPTLCFRGLENRAYYMLHPTDRAQYINFSGCGNTLKANHAIVRRMILDSLRYWVQVMHVDGFRFDLASILSRDEQGNPLPSSPLLWDIESDPVLAGVKLIAEAWDVGGLYQVGNFMGDFFLEWNGRFRDDVRSFWKGDNGTVRRVANRLLGSPDLYAHEEREPEQSVNFVACHDGFTLNDVVSYNEKHNWANRENNRDGSDYNLSWNCGREGPTDDPEVETLRTRQIKNLLATTLLSIGVPMLGMGDEVRRTQHGNNNPYAQDNPTSWFDWSLVERHAEILEFTRALIYLRQSMSLTQRQVQNAPLRQILRDVFVTWHGTRLNRPDWADDSHSLALSVQSLSGRHLFHIMLNAYWESLDFELPPPPSAQGWKRVLDTWLSGPEGIAHPDVAPPVLSGLYRVQPRSLVVLATRQTASGEHHPSNG
ncbi:MAG: glycogen debranching enzyme GlgX [Anaerolineae bacterium]|nr:MAG: glycogen debranching enzyme GlgX [Anaerolineae bacterium]